MLDRKLNKEIKRLKQIEKEIEIKKREEEKARKKAAIDESNKRISDIKKLAREYVDAALQDNDALIKVTKNILLDGKNFEYDITQYGSKVNPELLKIIFDRVEEDDFMLHFIDGLLEAILDKLDMKENFYIHHRFVDTAVLTKDSKSVKRYRTFSYEEQGKAVKFDEFG